jgi:Tol biopolymer transport system component
VLAGDWTEVRSSTDYVIHRALLTVPAAGGTLTTLASSDTVNLEDPTFTRDGASVTFVVGNAIRSIPATGVRTGELGTVLVGPLPSGTRPAHPAWSPDGSRLVYQVWESETFLSDLFVWNGVAGSQPVNVTTTDPDPTNLTNPYESSPSWLPDGRIVFNQGGNVWAVPAQAGAAKVLLADLSYDVRNVDARGA